MHTALSREPKLPGERVHILDGHCHQGGAEPVCVLGKVVHAVSVVAMPILWRYASWSRTRSRGRARVRSVAYAVRPQAQCGRSAMKKNHRDTPGATPPGVTA